MKGFVAVCLLGVFVAEAVIKRQPSHCRDVHGYSSKSGPYHVFAGIDRHPVNVYCDMETDGGGWTVILRRQNGTENFKRKWEEYEKGFGDRNGEYWLGLRDMHIMTSIQNYELRVDLESFRGDRAYAHYNYFSICAENDNYRLRLGNYSGNTDPEGNDAEVGFGYNKGLAFSTPDKDNDESAWSSCADTFHSGWWYGSCTFVNLNGLYMGENYKGRDGVAWFSWKGDESLRRAEMKIRPIADVPKVA